MMTQERNEFAEKNKMLKNKLETLHQELDGLRKEVIKILKSGK